MASAQSVTCGCARRYSTPSAATKRSCSATAATASSTSCRFPRRRRRRPRSTPRRSRPEMLPFDKEPPAGPVIAYIDGGARGNPGPAGFGVRIERADGTLVDEFSEAIGIATNNVAEYRGLLAALEWAKRHGRRG